MRFACSQSRARRVRGMLRRAMSTAARPIFGRIESKLTAGLAPSSLKIKDESFMLRGTLGEPVRGSGRGDALQGGDRLRGVRGKTAVARHRQVYALLEQEIKDGVHALSLKTKTPAEAERSTSKPL